MAEGLHVLMRYEMLLYMSMLTGRGSVTPVWQLLLILWMLCGASLMPALAQEARSDPCSAVAAKQKGACYRQQFAEADRALNAVYKRLAATLEAPRHKAMQDNSRRWIAYKDDLCPASTVINQRLEPAQAKNRAEYFACLYDLTVARLAYLQRAFAQEGVSPGLAGAYEDGFGGVLRLKHTTGDTYAFHIEVVRGPTYHTGEVEGTVRLDTKTATFVQTAECGGKTPCCRLTFTRAPMFIAVEEDNCQTLHGMRAYFSGEYRKVK